MKQLIPIINSLYDVVTAVGSNPHDLELPSIIVVGSQSSGKTSILESIVGKDFLPRGKGICTRRPLILQLLQKNKKQEYGIFSHKPNENYYDFNLIKKEIIEETKREVGNDNMISDNPINLKLYSKDFVNLTLIDLPGIIKVPVVNQPIDIGKKIRKMILKYIKNKNSIILAVIPANTDIATSDSLHIAKEVDPESKRTLGLVTKIDIMDLGCNVLDILHGNLFPLKYGYVGIKNRSQMDIINNVSIKDALKNESDFFSKNKIYQSISTRMGIPFLIKRLHFILLEHIKERLPSLRKKINLMINELNKELITYGDSTQTLKSTQAAMLLSLISKFSTAFIEAIDGRGRDLITTTELYGGAAISHIFINIFSFNLNSIDPFENLTDEDLRMAIRNSTGPRPSLFVPEVSFETLSKTQICRLRKPSIDCVELVYKEMNKIAKRVVTNKFSKYKQLKANILECFAKLLSENRNPTINMVNNLIDIELSYINTTHPDFIGGSKAVPTALKAVQESISNNQLEINKSDKSLKAIKNKKKDKKRISNSNNISDREKIETEIIKTVIVSYFNITKKNIIDSVPKSIMHFLVNKTKSEIQSYLVTMLYKEDKFEKILEEDPKIVKNRDKCLELLKVLKKALEVVDNVSCIQ